MAKALVCGVLHPEYIRKGADIGFHCPNVEAADALISKINSISCWGAWKEETGFKGDPVRYVWASTSIPRKSISVIEGLVQTGDVDIDANILNEVQSYYYVEEWE
jgi:hypothetical protein